MKDTSTTGFGILGLLAIRPWTTYELAKQVQRSLGWFWPRAERKLYDEPKHLVAEGLATARKEMTGARPRTVYEITPLGRGALRQWLGEEPQPPSLEFEGMVKTFFADGGSLGQLRATLASIEATARARAEELREMVATMPDDAEDEFAQRRHLNGLALRFQIGHEEHIAGWAEWAQAEIESWRSPRDPGDWDWRAAATGSAGRSRTPRAGRR